MPANEKQYLFYIHNPIPEHRSRALEDFFMIRKSSFSGNTHHASNRVHKYLDKATSGKPAHICMHAPLRAVSFLPFHSLPSSQQIRLNWMWLSFIEILFLCVVLTTIHHLAAHVMSRGRRMRMGNLFYFLIFYVIWIIKSFLERNSLMEIDTEIMPREVLRNWCVGGSWGNLSFWMMKNEKDLLSFVQRDLGRGNSRADRYQRQRTRFLSWFPWAWELWQLLIELSFHVVLFQLRVVFLVDVEKWNCTERLRVHWSST